MSEEEKPALCFAAMPEMIPDLWPKVKDLLQPAVDRSHGRWSMEHLYYILMINQQTLWIAMDENNDPIGVMTTQVVHYPCSKMLAFQFLGGHDLDEWWCDLLGVVERYAKDAGCAGIEATARFGFWPTLKQSGIEKSYTMYEKIFDGSFDVTSSNQED